MPIYAYRCSDCDRLTDTLASVGDAPAHIECAHCRGKRTHRIITGVAYHASEGTKTARLDPKYEKMVQHSLKKSASGDPQTLLKKMKPFGPKKD